MSQSAEPVLNPVGAIARARGDYAGRRNAGSRRVVGLIDNSKPNVSFFLEPIEETLRERFEIVRTKKPRSAGPCPDLAVLASRCDFVVNAVGD